MSSLWRAFLQCEGYILSIGVFLLCIYLSVFQVLFQSLDDFISVTSAYFPPLASGGLRISQLMGVVSIYKLVAKSQEALGCPQAPCLNMATQLLPTYYQKVLYNLVFFPKVYLSVFQVPFPSLADFTSVTSA